MIYPDYMDFYLSASIGLEGFEIVNIAGWSNTGVETKELLTLSSSSEADVDITIEITGLYNGLENTIEVDLEGTKPITIGALTRINSIIAKDNHEGIVTIGNHKISPFIGRSEVAIYSVPMDKDAYILSLSSSSEFEIDLKINGMREMIFKNWHKFRAPFKVEGDITFESQEDAYVIAQLLMQKRGK